MKAIYKRFLTVAILMFAAFSVVACTEETTTTTTTSETTTTTTTEAPTTTTTEAPETFSEGVRFEGVKLLGDYQFSLTIDADELPYFYETLYASYGPLPMHVLAPSFAQIDSNDDGATLVDAFGLIDDIVGLQGYRYYPTVTAGPYKFVSFVNQVVTLELDPLFKGDYLGKLPVIERVIQKKVNQTLDVNLVISGEIDLVTGVIEGQKIENAKAASTSDVAFYNRNGYGLLAMTVDFGPTMDVNVRQAVAHLTDRQYVTDTVLGGYGAIVASEYGLAQWMYQQSEQWVEENLDPYAFSVDSANEKLDLSDWKYESDGTTPWDKTKATSTNEYYRYNAAGEVLELKHFGTENNNVTTSLRDKFVLNMPLAGIKYSITIGTFDTLLDNYYFGFELGEDRTYHIFNLATNFGTTYDPYYSWHSDWLNTWYNSQGVNDAEIDRLTVEMRETTPGDNAAYLALWREYQERWNYLIPNVPLYSNEYYDVFDANLNGVTTTPFADWTAAIFDMNFDGGANEELVVGVPNMNGEFLAGFGNSSYDNYIRSLINGYSTYAATPAGEIVLNETVVKELVTTENEDGSKTYTFTLEEDLYWSDGVGITAADFVFAILFQGSAEWAKAGATSTSGEGLVGYSEYSAGQPA